MGCWKGDHVTDFLKWSKMKVVALHCSFQNLLQLCSEVLLLWRYDLKDFFSPLAFFDLFALFSMKTTPNNMISTHLES